MKGKQMSGLYDDNFGSWHDCEDEETMGFYRQVQNESVWKICAICDNKVKLRPQYDKCNSCMERMERGCEY